MLLFHLIEKALKAKRRLKFTKSEIKEFQIAEFRKLAKFATDNSSFYKKIVAENKINLETCVPEDFPILDKTILMENWDDIVTDKEVTKAKVIEHLNKPLEDESLFLNKYVAINTSGSSGHVGYFIFDQKELAAGISHSSRINGLKFNQKLAFIGATKGRFAGISMIKAAKRLPFLYKDVLTLDINSPTDKMIEELNKFQPTIVTAYATILPILAEAQKSGKLKINPRILNSSGEPINLEDENLVEKTFNAPVKNVYACSEHLMAGVGSKEYGGMYLFEDTLYFEFQESHTCITNLYNYTLPLICYQMNDVIVPMEDSQNVMPFTKVKNLIARKEYMPVFINKFGQDDFVHPIPLIGLYVEDLQKYQFQIESKSNFILNVKLTPGLSSEKKQNVYTQLTAKVREILNEKNMDNVQFEIQEVDELWVDPKTGKFKLILKNY